MVQYNKNIKNNKKGFTLVELMVVLAITAILAALVGGGLIAYTRLARFEKNEANARTLFQTAQISLTRMETAGELDAFRRQVMEEGSTGDHFQNDVTVTDADGKPLVSRTKTELNQNVAALYYDRTGAAAGNHNALVKELLGDYIYDASLLNASICVEIDVQSGQVYSVFYDTKSDKLRFNQDGATNIYDRSYGHRRNDTLVGYYSAEDRVNVVQLVQTKLKVKNPRLTNGETLTLSWSGNSSLGDLDTSYTATAYDAKDTGKTKPLFTITIKRDTAGAADDDKQVITEMPVTIYTYDNAGQRTETKKELYFPLSYNKGSFVLTLDAMADAALLRACENSAEVAATSLYSITRLLNDPKDIYIAMRAEPRENYSDTYTASKEKTTNEENTLLAKGGTAKEADLKYFRHLYNLRWSADWKNAGEGTYMLTPQASNSTGLNWTGGGVTVYCASGGQYPAAKVPSLNDPVAWPTIPELGEKIELTSITTGLTTQTTRVPILNLQLSSKSVAKTGKAEKDVLADHYVGLIGENKGKISYITLRDPDIQVNVKTETVAADTLPKADQLKLTATKFVTALAEDDENWRDVRAVGALCGVNTGTLENCALTRGTNSSTSALVAAALAFDNTTTAMQRKAQTLDAGSKSYTYYTDEPRGIGGLVGVAIPKTTDSVMQDLTVASDVAVAGLLVDKDTQSVAETTAADQQAEKARYAAAAAEPNDKNSLWRSVGVGGVFGTVDATQMTTNDDTNIVNNGFVTGNGFTGGIVGNLFTTDTSVSQSLTGLRNNGTVSAGANYKGDTEGDAHSLVLGQFFGGIAGYGRGVTLQGCESVTRSDLTETQLKEQVKAGFDTTGTLTDASPLKGDFVGGLVGYGKDITLEDCKTGKGYVLGSRFVGGLAGGFTGSGVQQNDKNSSDVFGNRYVGGIVSVNGGNSKISGMTNTGLVAAFGKNAAYVGGIVGANDADTKLTIQKATNGATENALSVGGLNPSNNGAFKGGVSLNALADGRYDFGTARGALAGGIIGYATPNTKLENCINYGTVAHKCAAGGFAGWNEGTITGGSMEASLGNRETGYTYLGGVAGVNGGRIQSAYPAQDCAVRGDSYVGGIAGVNLGGDAAASTRKGLIICTENNSTGTVEANQYAGGVAGANVGNISLSGQLQSSVTAADYAGGVAGINTTYNAYKGRIYGAENTNGTVLGSVNAAKYAGGVAGTNSAEITRVENHASVRASTQYAGGIAGVNDAGGKISACVHAQNQVYATNGEAGGIAGNNNKDALIENVQVRAAVTAANGTAGGVTATNFGIIGQETGLENNSSVSNCTITGTSESIGAVAAYNRAGATMRNVKLAENANVRFSTPAVTIGGLAGMNEGTVTGCQVENGALTLNNGLRAGTNTVTLGGAVGRTTKDGKVSSTNVRLDLTQNLDKYTNLGGVAGQNDGTLKQCTYSGTMGGNADTDGLVSVGARSTGSTVGGIAGLNNSTITGCEVKYIKLQVSGISNITTTQTADEKLASASHVGGIAGRNNAEIVNSYVATERSGGAGSIITARYGFVGGVAGSNNGTITGSGSKKALVSDGEATPALVTQVDNWLDAADANAGINSMAAELTTGKTYAGLKGVDTVTGYGYTNVYSDTGLAANDLLVALRGSNNSETVRAAGYLGGLAGFNSLHGTIDTSATGQWFVYSDNATTASTVGGIVGQNESNITDKSVLDTVVNCAAVRRFTHVKNEDDTDDDNIYKDGSRVVVHVGGVIGQQQNRSDDRWSVSKVVNCGSVFNSRSANVGGVIAYWLDYGGTVQKCFNFGKITTNTNDKNSGYGAVGGIVGFIDQPISGGTTNVLSCRNYGQIWYKSNGANDCAGIIGKIEMKKPTDIMTLNIIDCVNSGAIKAASQAVGILAWIGPYNKGNIDNVTVNIDRCRNLNTDFTCGGVYDRRVGIVGSRGNGSGSQEATNVTNCFATVGTGWYPIAYLRQSYENVTGHGNYYIEDSESAGKSFFKKDSRKLTTVKSNSTTGNWEKADEQGSDKAYNETDWNSSSGKVKAHRLYIGYNVDDKTYPYIAFLPTLADDENGAAYSLWWISGLTSAGPSAKPNSAYIKNDGNKAYIFDDTGAGDDTNPGKQRATVMLQFGEAANSTKSDVDITDITDEVIQNYYKYVLDSTKPAKPGKIHVKASQVQDADNNVYGRYEVTWAEPSDSDKNASPAAYYRVEILPCDAAGKVASDAVPYLKADVYQRSYTFVADKAWAGNFVVRVTPYNTNDDPTQVDNSRTSAVQTFMHALPTPEIEFRLVKRENGGFDWNQCQTPDEKSREFKYEVVAVLKNYTEYPTDEAWTVKLTDGKHTYYFSRQDGKQYIRLTQNLERTLTLTALATPDNSSSTKYLRSAQYKSETYLPSQWRDHNGGSGKDEDGLPLGKLNKDGDTEFVTYTGQTAESFEATVKFSFTPGVKSDSSEHGSPTYRVMLLAKYLGNDEVNGVSLNGQYITLAARESIVTESPVTFNLNSLPSDAMTNYTDFLVVAVPVTSGKGDMKYRWDATEEEVSTAIASHANETNDTGKEIWWKNGYEIVRTGEHSYTYAHLTPLCFSDVNRTDDPSWATQATVTTPQIIFKQLNLNVLKAPTLAETIGDGVVDNNNQLTYTFKWTQDDMKAADAAPDYQIKLYGLLTNADGKVTGQEQIALKDGVTLTPTQNGNSFTLPVNVDTMLANGSDSWRYDKVRLEVTRVAAAGTDEIGASAVADYSVKQRLPGISAPSSITRVNGETDNADALLYTVRWSPSDDARIDHYELCVVDDGGKPVLTLPTTGNVGSLTLDLEQYQGKTLRFRVVARRKTGSNCFDGPDGALSQSETIVRRADAPVVENVAFDNNSPNQEKFLNDLKLNMTLNAAAQGNVYFTGYIFSDADKYTEIANLAKAWQDEGTGQAKYTAQQELTKKLDEMLNNGDAELVIPKDSRTVGGSASADGTTASYTFVPDGNGFTLTPDHAKQYLLPAVRVMPTDGTTASNWFYILQQDTEAAQLPAITLDAPVDAAEPERALGNAVYKQEVNLYNDPECKTNRGTTPLELRRFTVEWTAVNKYTQTDGTVRNLTDSYSFTVTPLDKDKKPYIITVTTYDRDVTDIDGNVTHKRGEIKTVTKTIGDKKTNIDPTNDVNEAGEVTRIWYDLSVEPVYDKDNNLTGWESQPYDVTGTVEKDGGTLYYKAQTVPMLELVQEDGAEPVYRITLPELQEKVQDDSLALQKFTASVMLQTLAHSDNNGKTVASGSVKVPVNETNTADAAEDAQSMDSTESVAPAETAESTAAESAPASVPPVLMRARAALPMATPETAAAPDETDAAKTAPPKRTETSDAS